MELELDCNGFNLNRSHEHRGTGIYTLIETFLGKNRMPKNCIGINQLKCLPGIFCYNREQLCLLGLHFNAARDISMTSDMEDTPVIAAVVLNGGDSDWLDMGSKFVYVAHGGSKQFDFSDHSLYTQENISLVNSCKLENPIRVIRSFRGKSKFSPMGGYRYDGLYRIIDFFVDTNSRDKRIYKFVVLNEKAIFQVSLREIVPLSSSDHDSILINFIVLFKTIKRVYIDYCNKMECAPVWLETVKLYELPQFHPSKPEWARGGFLPFLLRVKYQNVMDSPAFTRENKNLFAPSFSPHMTNTREYRSTWQHFTLPINRRMAQRLAHQFFPESRNPLIFTEIVLNAPMDNAWNPWEDLSHGEENFPLKVENLVDSTTPPLDFTYSKKNVFFSRLIPPDLMKNCPGCLPAGVDTSQWPIRNSSIYCIGKQNPANGRIYCAGRDVEKIQLFNFNFTCGDLCPCDPSACTTRYLPGLKFRCKLVKTLTKNWELQTEEFIPSGRFILQYAGEVISRVVMEGREHISEKLGHSNYFMESVEKEEKSDDWMMPCIDSSIIGNAARFLNHSCSPNVCVKTVWCCSDFPVLCVSALRDIEVHETLTYYYGQSYQQIKCLCGSLNCEGFIGRKPSSPSKR
ncbi:histone lysine methyltransferase SET/SUV39 [Cardiosporidium cionae]|uniref:Histone lysine methyltransferase SET/SUV39 n=1 Tax=Cardiosporidium cionae TaxID=476202 RepID=A0ABQ7JEN5_9APIC|nr:histone lysine methyltransferase SET/SUV39 [Cardiosporidium cionae]|eukprot:KAF8822459.1 histone lysine methyltransferase SET/SUV39 [Cardiosporidium cionae]